MHEGRRTETEKEKVKQKVYEFLRDNFKYNEMEPQEEVCVLTFALQMSLQKCLHPSELGSFQRSTPYFKERLKSITAFIEGALKMMEAHSRSL